MSGTLAGAGFDKGWAADRATQQRKFFLSIDVHFKKISSPIPGFDALDFLILDLKNFDEFDPTFRKTIVDTVNAKYSNLLDHFLIIN